MRLVLDTNVIVAAMRSPRGASAKLLASAKAGKVQLYGTLSLALEYIEVCGRREQCDAAGISETDGVAFGVAAAALMTPVVTRFRWRPQLQDPGDEHVLEAAINAASALSRELQPQAFRDGCTAVRVGGRPAKCYSEANGVTRRPTA